MYNEMKNSRNEWKEKAQALERNNKILGTVATPL